MTHDKRWPYGSIREARIEALERAWYLIEKGSERYICFALDMIHMDYPHLSWACNDLRHLIHMEINGQSSLQVFILNEMFPKQHYRELAEPYQTDYLSNQGVMQLARLAWIDRLIANEA